jgi:Ser/Thr protein kinase RdoA (MazF antagonist)
VIQRVGAKLPQEGDPRREIVRIGDTIRRPRSDRWRFVHDVLRHLEATGFAGAPRVAEVSGDGTETLWFIPGCVPAVNDWSFFSDAQLAAVARLLREMHDALAGTPLAARAETVCHNDLKPSNTIFDHGRPVAFIDFDHASPGMRLPEVAEAAWFFLGLGRLPICPEEQARRLKIFADAYRCANAHGLLRALISRQLAVLQWEAAQATQEQRSLRRVLLDAVATIQDITWVVRFAPLLADAVNDRLPLFDGPAP